MTSCSKTVQERDMKFYVNSEAAEMDDFVFLTVEVEGNIPPPSVTKTVLENRYDVISIGPSMAYVGAGNLRSARFQLVRICRKVPLDLVVHEDVYIFETFIN